MSMTLARLLAVSAAITGYARAEPPSPIAVDVWRSGDDGLTVRFAEALETALRRSHIFTLGSRQRPARLLFEIPQIIEWTEIGGRAQFHFQVNFKSVDSRVVGTSRGTCWETNFDVCAAMVLSDARRTSEHSTLPPHNGERYVPSTEFPIAIGEDDE
jgi:hypothetical protein